MFSLTSAWRTADNKGQDWTGINSQNKECSIPRCQRSPRCFLSGSSTAWENNPDWRRARDGLWLPHLVSCLRITSKKTEHVSVPAWDSSYLFRSRGQELSRDLTEIRGWTLCCRSSTLVCFQSVVHFNTGRVIYTRQTWLHFWFLYESSENKVLPSDVVVTLVCNSRWHQKNDSRRERNFYFQV